MFPQAHNAKHRALPCLQEGRPAARVCPRNAETYNHVSVFSFSKLSSEVLSAHSSPLVNLVTIAILLTLKQVTDLAVRFYNFNLAFLETEWPPCMTLGGR